MRKDSLSARQIEDYAERGYVSPLTAFTPEEAARQRARLEAMERSEGGITHDRARKMHLYLCWVDEIVHHPRILDAVQDLIGPDILLYHLTLWLKEPNSDARISWHQDSTYFGDLFAHVVRWRSELYLEDGLHRALRAALQQRIVLHARVYAIKDGKV